MCERPADGCSRHDGRPAHIERCETARTGSRQVEPSHIHDADCGEQGPVFHIRDVGDGCDGVKFDPELKRIYTSNGEGTMTIIQEVDANTLYSSNPRLNNSTLSV